MVHTFLTQYICEDFSWTLDIVTYIREGAYVGDNPTHSIEPECSTRDAETCMISSINVISIYFTGTDCVLKK